MGPSIYTYMSASIVRSTVRIPFTLAGQACRIEASVEDSINLQTGDAIFLCSVNSIIVEEDGQSMAPATLSAAEFRSLLVAIRNKHSL